MFTYMMGKPQQLIIPTGLIIPYTAGGGGAPSGWSAYNTANGYTIVGAGNTYAVNANGASAGDFVANIATAGGHYGVTPMTGLTNDGGKWRNVGEAGAHVHTATFTYTPPYQNCYLIKSGADQTEFPTYSVVWTYGQDKSGVGSNIWTSGDMFRSFLNTSSGGTNTYNSVLSTSAGSHGHGISDSGDGSGLAVGVTRGAHTHTINITMTNTLYQQALAAWSNASSAVSLNSYGSNIIGMYESTTPPDGWYLCDGNNGTPNMKDYFVKNTTQASAGSNSGDGTLTAATASTIVHGLHNHYDNNESSGGTKSSYHTENVQTPAHAQMSDNQWWRPAYYALAFIMKG